MVLILSTRYEKLVPRHSFPRKKLTLWSSLLRNPVELWIEILLIEIHTALPIMSYPNQIRIHLTVTHTSHRIEITFTFFRDGKEHDQCSKMTYCRLKICVYSGCFKLIKTEMYPHSSGSCSCLHHKQWALWPGHSGQPVLPRISKVSQKQFTVVNCSQTLLKNFLPLQAPSSTYDAILPNLSRKVDALSC